MRKILIFGVIGFIMFGCKERTEHSEALEISETSILPITSTFMELNEIDSETTEKPEVVKEARYWSSSEIGLPKGVVYTMDCANRGTAEVKLKDNYVTIKRPNGYLTITRDIDEDLFLNLQNGDIIE